MKPGGEDRRVHNLLGTNPPCLERAWCKTSFAPYPCDARTAGTAMRQKSAEIREKWRKLNEKRMLPAKRNIRIEWAVLDLNQ